MFDPFSIVNGSSKRPVRFTKSMTFWVFSGFGRVFKNSSGTIIHRSLEDPVSLLADLLFVFFVAPPFFLEQVSLLLLSVLF